MQWKFFCSSGFIASQSHRLSTETYSRAMASNKRLKTIANSNFTVTVPHQHYANYTAGKFAVDSRLRRTDGPFVSSDVYEDIQLNHYWSRSLEEFTMKVLRGRGHHSAPRRKLVEFQWHEEKCDSRAPSPRTLPDLKYLLGLSETGSSPLCVDPVKSRSFASEGRFPVRQTSIV